MSDHQDRKSQTTDPTMACPCPGGCCTPTACREAGSCATKRGIDLPHYHALVVRRPIFTVYEGNCYWSMPDGSNWGITPDDAKRINDALRLMDNQHDR